MKEAFFDLATSISQASVAGDLELNQYLTSLSPTGKASFTTSNINDAIASVKLAKQQRYTDMADQVTGADNNITQASYYVTRTQDMINMIDDIDGVASGQVNNMNFNTGLAGRQHEINEWANLNKLDTLFFMQILFICLSFIAGSMYLKTTGVISSSLFTLFSVLAGALAVFTLISRARFTSKSRDSRYWHKVRFPSMPGTITPASTTCPTTGSDTNSFSFSTETGFA
jgi:hypothetical protein